MHFHILALICTVGLVQALPSTLTARDDRKCGESLIINHWRSNGPSVSDCKALLTKLERQTHVGVNGTWEEPLQQKPPIFTSGARPVYSQGSCTFAVASADAMAQAQLWMGKDDIVGLIEESIKSYQKDGKVEVRGALFCGKPAFWWSLLTMAELQTLNQGDRD